MAFRLLRRVPAVCDDRITVAYKSIETCSGNRLSLSLNILVSFDDGGPKGLRQLVKLDDDRQKSTLSLK